MKINSAILKGIYRICINKGLLVEGTTIYKWATEQLSQLEANYQIESLIPIDTFTDLFTQVLEKQDISEWGWFIGQQLKTTDLGILGHYLHSCNHMIYAHQKLNKYQLLLSDMVSFHFESNGNHIIWNLTTPILQRFDTKIVQLLNDFEIAYRHHIVLELTQKQFSPAAIHVVYPYTPKHALFLENKYQCPIIFDKDVSTIFYQIEDINSQVPSQNYYVYYQTEHILIDLLQKWYQDSNNYSLITKRFILSNLGHFHFSIQLAAERLNISTRHLQRHLENEGTSYNQILEESRKEMSIIYIKKGLLNKEIAQRLGYTETNSFVRAFKKWFGVNIRTYKKTLTGTEIITKTV